MLGEVIPHAGCQALYHLENLNDSSGNGHTLITDGYYYLDPLGKFGNGLAYAEYPIGNYGVINVDLGSKIWGISFWFKISHDVPVGIGYEFVIWYKTYISYYTSIVRVTYANPEGIQKIQIELNTSGQPGTLANFSAIHNRWYKCDVTADGTKAYLYINAVKYLEATIPGNAAGYGYSDYLSVFGSVYDDNNMVGGMMDEVALFDYHRTEQDIVRQYAFEMGLLL